MARICTEKMSEYPISISNLNDFIFCPVSIYFHSLDDETEKMTYQSEYQINGTSAHEKTDTGAYSTKKSMLQAIPVYSEKYNIMGKIDMFDCEKGVLTERIYIFKLSSSCKVEKFGYAKHEDEDLIIIS